MIEVETGQSVSVTATCRDINEVLVNPDTIAVTIVKPDGSVLTPAITPSNPSTGIYTATFTPDVRGTWAGRWVTTNPDTASDFIVVAGFSSETLAASSTLITVQEYRDITKDTTSENEQVGQALLESIAAVEDYLQRPLALGERTETLEVIYIDFIGYVYPTATPVSSVDPDAAYTVDVGERRLRGVQADPIAGVAWPDYGPLRTASQVDTLSPFTRQREDYATVTYVGGYTNETLPYTLKRYIALLARRFMTWSPDTVIGASDLKVGDIAVKYPKISNGLDAMVPGLSFGLKPYKRKRVRP